MIDESSMRADRPSEQLMHRANWVNLCPRVSTSIRLRLHGQNGRSVLALRTRSKHLKPEHKRSKGNVPDGETILLHRPKLDQIRVNCLCVSNHPEGFTLNRQQVMMYSINELILSGCWKLGENTTHSKQSCPMDMRSEICVKRENAQPFLNSTDHQVAMGLLPIESSLQADLLSNTDRSLPEDFYEELVDPPIDQPPWVGIGKQPDKQVKKEIFSPAQITSRNRDDVLGQVTSSSTIPLYGWTTQMQVPTFQMKSFQDGPTPTVYQPIPTYENGSSSPEYHPDWLQVSKPPENNIVVTNRTCPVKNCQCICHERPQNVSPHLSSFHDEEQQRPGVIMVPVSHKETAVSVVTHVPLQMTTTGHLSKPLEIPVQQFVRNRVIVDDTDSEKEENYFQMATHKTKARFKLSKTDWVKIPIKRFPSGGRLLGGQWTQIFSSKVKPSNPWCSLRFKNNHVRSENSRKMHSAPFFRGAAECKRPECAVKLQFVIQEEKGKYVDVMCIGNVSHKISD